MLADPLDSRAHKRVKITLEPSAVNRVERILENGQEIIEPNIEDDVLYDEVLKQVFANARKPTEHASADAPDEASETKEETAPAASTIQWSQALQLRLQTARHEIAKATALLEGTTPADPRDLDGGRPGGTYLELQPCKSDALPAAVAEKHARLRLFGKKNDLEATRNLLLNSAANITAALQAEAPFYEQLLGVRSQWRLQMSTLGTLTNNNFLCVNISYSAGDVDERLAQIRRQTVGDGGISVSLLKASSGMYTRLTDFAEERLQARISQQPSDELSEATAASGTTEKTVNCDDWHELLLRAQRSAVVQKVFQQLTAEALKMPVTADVAVAASEVRLGQLRITLEPYARVTATSSHSDSTMDMDEASHVANSANSSKASGGDDVWALCAHKLFQRSHSRLERMPFVPPRASASRAAASGREASMASQSRGDESVSAAADGPTPIAMPLLRMVGQAHRRTEVQAVIDALLGQRVWSAYFRPSVTAGGKDPCAWTWSTEFVPFTSTLPPSLIEIELAQGKIGLTTVCTSAKWKPLSRPVHSIFQLRQRLYALLVRGSVYAMTRELDLMGMPTNESLDYTAEYPSASIDILASQGEHTTPVSRVAIAAKDGTYSLRYQPQTPDGPGEWRDWTWRACTSLQNLCAELA